MAARTGFSFNEVEIDKQFQELQKEIDTKLGANPETGDPAQRAQSTTLPQVTGIRTNNQIVGALSFEWNAVTISNLLYYDVQVSSLENFVGTHTKSYKVTGQTFFIVSDVAPDQARYARVRVATPTGFGAWSSSLNTQTGKATPNQLVVGASSNIVRHVQTAFDPPMLHVTDGPFVAEYGFIDIETIGGLVIIFSTIEYFLQWFVGMKLTIALKEDGNEILSFNNHIINVAPGVLYPALGGPENYSQVVQSFPGMAIPSAPPAGVHTYNWTITVENVPPDAVVVTDYPDQSFTPLNITTALVEFRR